MRFDEYAALDGVGLAELIRRRELSASEVLRACLHGLDEINPKVNAVVARFSDRIDAALERDAPSADSALAGVPMLLKDTMPLAGTILTFGSTVCRDFVSPHTHPVADRLMQGGLPLIGRTNMCELGLTPTTEPALFGPTHNPWNRAYSPGGSSGGAAAAVAAGLAPVAHASDGGGSIRIPASACGLFGLKPSRGRVPSPTYSDPEGFIVEGCISRTVRDTAAFLDLVEGPDLGAKFRIERPPAKYVDILERDPPRLKIGYTLECGKGHAVPPSVGAAIEKMAQRCADLGHHVEAASPGLDGDRYFQSFLVLWRMCAGYFIKAVRRGILERPEVPKPLKTAAQTRAGFEAMLWVESRKAGRPAVDWFLKRLAEEDRHQDGGDVWMAWQDLHEETMSLVRFLTSYDLLLTPVLGEPVWKTGTLTPEMSREELEDRLTRYVGFTPYMNTSGLPAMSVPAGFDDAGLPVGAHFVAPMGREDRLLQLAAQIERAFPWSQGLPVRLP